MHFYELFYKIYISLLKIVCDIQNKYIYIYIYIYINIYIYIYVLHTYNILLDIYYILVIIFNRYTQLISYIYY